MARNKIIVSLAGLCVAAGGLVLTAASTASPPRVSPAYALAGGGTNWCGEPDLQFSEYFYVLGTNGPQGWWNKLPPSPPPPGVKLLPQAPLRWDTRNVAAISIDNPCPDPVLIYFQGVDGSSFTGRVDSSTTVFLTREDLMAANLWQAEIVGEGAGSCFGGGPTCYDIPVDFVVTNQGVTRI
jgi:hypothetical protein